MPLTARLLSLLALSLTATVAAAQSSSPGAAASAGSATTQPAAPMANMTSHTMVLLVLAENPPKLEPAAAAELQKQHMAHIQFMGNTGKVLAAGPFGNRDDETIRGMLIFSCDIDEARAMANEDPAVKAGRLKVVCMKWWTDKDAVAFPWAQQRAKDQAAK